MTGNSVTEFGDGIYNVGGTLTLTNSIVSANSAGNDGGGISNFNTLTLTNSTVSGNSAANGGGIYTLVTPALNNSIVANSTAGGDCFDSTATAQYSLVEDGGCGVAAGSGNLNGDPNLDAGLVLNTGSPAIDAGSNALVPTGVTTDRAGNPRIQDGTVDMGAFESSFTAAPVTASATGGGSITEGGSSTITLTRTGNTGSTPRTGIRRRPSPGRA